MILDDDTKNMPTTFCHWVICSIQLHSSNNAIYYFWKSKFSIISEQFSLGGNLNLILRKNDTYSPLAASPRRACGGRRTFGFAERFAAPQRPSAVGVLVLVPRGGSARLRRAITQALRAWLRALRAQTKSSPTASIERSAFGRIKTRLRRAIWQALRARTKNSPTASTTFGLRPNWNPPTAGR